MSDKPTPDVPESTYERVMVAAREARRLNERSMRSGIQPRDKATLEAIDRVNGGEVAFTYAPPEPDPEPMDETPGTMPFDEGGAQ